MAGAAVSVADRAAVADGIALSLRDFHAIPGGQVYTPVLTDRSKPHSWFAMYNADYPLLVGYVFPTDDHPWIIDWQNQPRDDSAAGTARGIEFGTSPFDEGLRKSVERGADAGRADLQVHRRASAGLDDVHDVPEGNSVGFPGCPRRATC